MLNRSSLCVDIEVIIAFILYSRVSHSVLLGAFVIQQYIAKGSVVDDILINKKGETGGR